MNNNNRTAPQQNKLNIDTNVKSSTNAGRTAHQQMQHQMEQVSNKWVNKWCSPKAPAQAQALHVPKAVHSTWAAEVKEVEFTQTQQHLGVIITRTE